MPRGRETDYQYHTLPQSTSIPASQTHHDCGVCAGFQHLRMFATGSVMSLRKDGWGCQYHTSGKTARGGETDYQYHTLPQYKY